jgi:hypothetical protein
MAAAGGPTATSRTTTSDVDADISTALKQSEAAKLAAEVAQIEGAVQFPQATASS